MAKNGKNWRFMGEKWFYVIGTFLQFGKKLKNDKMKNFIFFWARARRTDNFPRCAHSGPPPPRDPHPIQHKLTNEFPKKLTTVYFYCIVFICIVLYCIIWYATLITKNGKKAASEGVKLHSGETIKILKQATNTLVSCE